MPQLSLHTPIGDLTVSEEAGAIVSLDWGWGRDQGSTPLLRDVCGRLAAFFDGARADFTDVPVEPGGTAYRRRVWSALRAIPSGQTRSYGELAGAVGGCARSIGQANRANPVPIIIPCHRVVGRSGLGGYSGGGDLDTKRHLLDLERAGGAPDA